LVRPGGLIVGAWWLFMCGIVGSALTIKAVEQERGSGLFALFPKAFRQGGIAFMAAKHHPVDSVKFSAEVQIRMGRGDQEHPVPRGLSPEDIEFPGQVLDVVDHEAQAGVPSSIAPAIGKGFLADVLRLPGQNSPAETRCGLDRFPHQCSGLAHPGFGPEKIREIGNHSDLGAATQSKRPIDAFGDSACIVDL